MRCLRVALVSAGLALPVCAQQAPSIAAAFDSTQWLRPDSPLEFDLSRPLRSEDGRLALFVGNVDVSALTALSNTRVAYRSRAAPLPAGESTVLVYLVGSDEQWNELARFRIRVLQRGGFEKLELMPRLALNNKGQVAEGSEPATADARTFQDFSGNFGVQTVLQRDGWQLRMQSNYIGVSRQEEALRFGQQGGAAPKVDLSDYLVTLERGPLTFRLGDVGYGAHRHLIAGTQQRGVVTDLALTRFARMSLAGLSGSTVVGWSDLLGVTRPSHRLLAGNIAIEALPSRPGLVQLDAGWLNGSVLPIAGFSQGVVNDRETSSGAALRVLLQDPAQRVRMEAGYARSRFQNPTDPLLAQGSVLVPVRTETRNAQFLDFNAHLLRNEALTPTLPVNVTLVARHERVEPLYRTIALPGTRADVLQNTVELIGTMGAATLQLSHTRSRDNLDGIPTILSTRTRVTQTNLALSPAAILNSTAHAWLPVLSGGISRVHQLGLGAPLGSEAFATFVPDQISTTYTVTAQSQGRSWQALVRLDQSAQDNRQLQRENADFNNVARAMSLGWTPAPVFTVTLELGQDFARSKERGQKTTTNRIGGSVSWHPKALTVDAGVLTARTADNPATFEQKTTDARVELSWSMPVMRTRTGRQNAQLFVRYGYRTNRHSLSASGERTAVRNWNVNTGVTLAVF